MRESGTCGLVTCDSVIYELEDVCTGGRVTHESGPLSYGTQGHEERGREDSLRRGTVSMRARERDKQTSPDFCA